MLEDYGEKVKSLMSFKFMLQDSINKLPWQDAKIYLKISLKFSANQL